MQELLDAIAGADALLIATPEYNASVPGGSRTRSTGPRARSRTTCCSDKPSAVIGASTGLFGAVWAQAEVRKVLSASGADVVENELPVGMADSAFTDDGRLADPELAARLADVVGDLAREVTAPAQAA